VVTSSTHYHRSIRPRALGLGVQKAAACRHMNHFRAVATGRSFALRCQHVSEVWPVKAEGHDRAVPLVSYERPSLAPTILATNRASAIFDAVPAHHEHNRTKFEAQLARHPYARAASGRFWYTNRWSLSRVTIIFPEHPGKYYCGLLEVTLALY
jgi:hypothetical protein